MLGIICGGLNYFERASILWGYNSNELPRRKNSEAIGLIGHSTIINGLRNIYCTALLSSVEFLDFTVRI